MADGRDDDPYSKVKVRIAYLVAGVWMVMFLFALIDAPSEPSLWLSVQASFAAVLGWLYADRWRRK